MFYTMEEAAIIGGFLELYLERDSVDPAVREQHRRFRQGLLGGALELPAVQEIDHTLSAMQELVGGTIQAVYPFDDPVALVCNDEGKLLGLPWNRALTDDHGVPYDIVCGTFFVAGLKEDDFASLTEQQIEKYKDKYSNEMILSVPKQPEAHKKPMKKEKHEYER